MLQKNDKKKLIAKFFFFKGEKKRGILILFLKKHTRNRAFILHCFQKRRREGEVKETIKMLYKMHKEMKNEEAM